MNPLYTKTADDNKVVPNVIRNKLSPAAGPDYFPFLVSIMDAATLPARLRDFSTKVSLHASKCKRWHPQ